MHLAVCRGQIGGGEEAAALGWGWVGMGDGAGPQCSLQAHCKARISALGFRPCRLGHEGTEPQLDKRTPSCTEHCPREPERETMP